MAPAVERVAIARWQILRWCRSFAANVSRVHSGNCAVFCPIGAFFLTGEFPSETTSDFPHSFAFGFAVLSDSPVTQLSPLRVS